jgi:YebC/PmpR family DNA-binding regulatory protein
VDCLTDNRNRTAPELRKIFERAGGQLGNSGCVAYLFEQRGRFVIAADKAEEDALMELALENGAEDVLVEEDGFVVTSEVSAFSAIRDALASAGIETLEGEIAMIPSNTISVDVDHARQIMNLYEALEENDDVQKVYANFEMPDDVMSQLE